VAAASFGAWARGCRISALMPCARERNASIITSMSTASQTGVAEVLPELNPALDREALAEEFARSKRIHITNILTQASAERVYRTLADETAWTTTHNTGGKCVDERILGQKERARISLAAWRWAHQNFAYLYDNHRMSHDGEPYADQNHYLAKFVSFLNSPAFIGFIRELTGMPAVAYADAQATLYRAGDFLTEHDDTAGDKNRLAAYVFSFTTRWLPDWGGVLEFVNDRTHIGPGFIPEFNSLNLFSVPHIHLVSQVTLFGGKRYSVTGWLRSF
jgi:SM-20-related protein